MLWYVCGIRSFPGLGAAALNSNKAFSIYSNVFFINRYVSLNVTYKLAENEISISLSRNKESSRRGEDPWSVLTGIFGIILCLMCLNSSKIDAVSR